MDKDWTENEILLIKARIEDLIEKGYSLKSQEILELSRELDMLIIDQMKYSKNYLQLKVLIMRNNMLVNT